MIPIQDHFRSVYDSLVAEQRRLRPQVLPRGPLAPDEHRFPSVRLHPSGEATGLYAPLLKFLQAHETTGRDRRGGVNTLQTHHLLEDRVMQPLGVPRAEGLCIAIEVLHHQLITLETMRHLPRRLVYQIADVWDAHSEIYEDAEQPHWNEWIRDWLNTSRVRHQIMGHYSARIFPGSTQQDEDRAREFFAELALV